MNIYIYIIYIDDYVEFVKLSSYSTPKKLKYLKQTFFLGGGLKALFGQRGPSVRNSYIEYQINWQKKS